MACGTGLLLQVRAACGTGLLLQVRAACGTGLLLQAEWGANLLRPASCLEALWDFSFAASCVVWSHSVTSQAATGTGIC